MNEYNKNLLERINKGKELSMSKNSKMLDEFGYDTKDKVIFMLGLESGYQDGVLEFLRFLDEVKDKA